MRWKAWETGGVRCGLLSGFPLEVLLDDCEEDVGGRCRDTGVMTVCTTMRSRSCSGKRARDTLQSCSCVVELNVAARGVSERKVIGF
jgi:hypothetical protein